MEDIKAPGRTLYVEESILENPNPLAQKILKSHANECIIPCAKYTEVFNPKKKHFRLQKEYPALILAHKRGNLVQKAPYGIGGKNNYYFSHMLNCMYDCSYCFLQGMYASAMTVLFVNYEDFQKEIFKTTELHLNEETFFFSGYDCDSLAYEPLSLFAARFLPFFSETPSALLELRTKSVQIQSLLNLTPIPNCIVAFSLAPQTIVERYEAKTPSLSKRLDAMSALANAGWTLGIRLDPIMAYPSWQEDYDALIEQLIDTLPNQVVHSITLGTLRFPQALYKNMIRLYPVEKIFVENMVTDAKKDVYLDPDIHANILNHCTQALEKKYDSAKIIDNALML